MAKMEDAFNDFYNEFKDWTKKQILHRTFDIILKDTEEIGEKDKEIERLNIKLEKIKDIVLCYGETFDSKLHQEMQKLILDVIGIKTGQAELKEGVNND